MDILLIWLATIILSGAMSITLVIKFLKEAKRNGYVINHDYKDNNESYMNKLTVLMMFTPIVNISGFAESYVYPSIFIISSCAFITFSNS